MTKPEPDEPTIDEPEPEAPTQSNFSLTTTTNLTCRELHQIIRYIHY